jgi:hypothetical protein
MLSEFCGGVIEGWVRFGNEVEILFGMTALRFFGRSLENDKGCRCPWQRNVDEVGVI